MTTLQKLPSFVPEFEGLRGILAWWVVLGHMALFAGFSATTPQSLPMGLILHGGTAVEVFIILSGFVIFFLLDKDQQTNTKEYLLGRAFRIIPVYWVLLTLAALLLPVEQMIAAGGDWSNAAENKHIIDTVSAAQSHLGLHYGLHLSLLHGLLPDRLLPHSGDAIIGAAWSISLEWQFYLLAPLLYLLAKRKLAWGIALCGAIVATKIFINRSGLTFSYGAFLPMKFEFFCLGMGSYLLFKRICATGNLLSNLLLLYGLVLCAFGLMVFTGGLREHSYSVAIWLLCFSAAAFRICGKHWLLPVSNLLCSKPVAAAGRISYSTYLCHQLSLWLIILLITSVLGTHLSRGQFFACLALIGGLAIYVASWLLHRYIETPGIALGKRLRNRLSERATPMAEVVAVSGTGTH